MSNNDKSSIILEHTQLALEYANLGTAAQTEEEWAVISKRKEEIKKRIQELRLIESEWEEFKGVEVNLERQE